MRPYEEAVAPGGAPRPQYAEVLAALEALGPAALAARAQAAARAAGLAVGAQALAVDPVPRVITAAEWAVLEARLAQRARALDALVRAAYASGAETPLTTSRYFEPDLVGAPVHGPSVAIVGFDVVRGPDGVLRVLEDNVLSPGHVAVPVARELNPLAGQVRTAPRPTHAATRGALLAMLGGGDGAAILGDDPPRWELRRLGRMLGVPVVSPGDLHGTPRGLRLRADGRRVQVLWQRTAEDRLRDDAGRSTHLGELLLAPLREGTVRVVNRIGSGVVHDKRALPLVGGPMPAVPTLLLERPEDRAAVLADRAAYVVKPATGGGGRGVRFGSDLRAGALEALLADEPEGWVAQPRVALAVHPTVAGDALVPRPVDLRVFAVHTGDGYEILPGGVSRYPTTSRSGIVNTSAGGGIKDVWVMPAVGEPATLRLEGRRAAHVV